MKPDFYRDFYLERYHRDGPVSTYQRRGSLQLWQFLVALLDDPTNASFIAWTGRGLEFKLIEPEEVSGYLSKLLASVSGIFPRREVGCLRRKEDENRGLECGSP